MQSNELGQTPSLSTTRRWMKKEVKLSYKKINIHII